MTQVFLCIHSFPLIKEIMERLTPLSSVNVVGLTTVLPIHTSVFQKTNIDVLFLDCTYALDDAILLGRAIQEDTILHMNIVYLFNPLDEEILQYITEGNIQSYLCHPFNADGIVNAIGNESGNSENDAIPYNSKESIIVQTLQRMGLPVHLQGYTFLKYASLLVLESPKEIHLPMKSVYKEVARKHTTTVTRVEKSIRTAIDFAYRVAPNKIKIQGKKPTNSQIIHYVSEQVHVTEISCKKEVLG